MSRIPSRAILVLSSFLFLFVPQLSAAIKVSSVSVNPGSVSGGTTAMVVVTLTSYPTNNPIYVSVKSSNTAVVGNVTVMVQVPYTTGYAMLPTYATASNATVTLTATYGGSKATTTLTVLASCPIGTTPQPWIPPTDSVWVDDSAPALTQGTWDTAQAASGTQSLTLASAPPGVQSGFGFGLPSAVTPSSGDRFVAHVLIDPCNRPTSLGFTWSASAGGQVYGAYWGQQNSQWDSNGWTRLGPLPAAGTWARLTAPASALAGLAVDASNTYQIGGKVWYDSYGMFNTSCPLPMQPQPAAVPTDTVWIDDTAAALNQGTWDTSQAASGTQSLVVANAPAGVQSGFAFGLDWPWVTVSSSDVFFVYVLLDRCNPPASFGFTWNASASGRVMGLYWGAPRTQWDSTGWFRHMGPLPETGTWTRIAVPASALSGMVVDVMNTYQIGGTAWYDRYGEQ